MLWALWGLVDREAPIPKELVPTNGLSRSEDGVWAARGLRTPELRRYMGTWSVGTHPSATALSLIDNKDYPAYPDDPEDDIEGKF
jgi:hypothetical protein